nr:hypothetical protein [Tanacetum cinerariifolium]
MASSVEIVTFNLDMSNPMVSVPFASRFLPVLLRNLLDLIDIKLLKLDVMLRDNALAELRKKFEKAKKERNDLKLTLDKFQTSSKNLKLYSQESANRVPKTSENDRYKTGEGCHVVPPPYTGTFMPPKLDLVFTDDPNASESVANVFNVESRICLSHIGLIPLLLKIGYVKIVEHNK